VSQKIKLRIDGEPIPQPRPRAVAQGGFVRVITAKRKHPINAFKQQVRMLASVAWEGPPLTGAVQIVVTFVMPRPQRLMWARKPMPRRWCKTLPDFDNLVKALIDPLKGICWKDDGQIAVARIVKVVAAGDERTHTIIEISELEDFQ
jgi:Holliday junction resolvase RusA-like endonuclease